MGISSIFRQGLLAEYGTDKMITFTVSALANQVAEVETWGVGNDTAVFIYWGDGTYSTGTRATETQFTHVYTADGTYVISVRCDNQNLSRFYFLDNTTVNVMYSNEAWHLQPRLAYLGCRSATSTVALTTLPPSITSINMAFGTSALATLPIKRIPSGVTDIFLAFPDCSNALLPFTDIPDNIIKGARAFARCHKAKTKITKLPETLVYSDGMFSKCYEMDIQLHKFPPGIESLKQTFEYTQAVINLDEIAYNAPEGGFQALTDLDGAFYHAPNVIGSRSSFLKVCPNVQTMTNAFAGSSTTE